MGRVKDIDIRNSPMKTFHFAVQPPFWRVINQFGLLEMRFIYYLFSQLHCTDKHDHCLDRQRVLERMWNYVYLPHWSWMEEVEVDGGRTKHKMLTQETQGSYQCVPSAQKNICGI